MDFFDNVVNKSNALIKERLNNPFGSKQPATQGQDGNNLEDQSQASQQQQSGQVGTSLSAADQASTSATTVTDGQQQQTDAPADVDEQLSDKNSQFAAIAADAELVAQKAAKGAQKFGTFLFSMANKAGQSVTQTAKQVKQAVENTSILSDYTREQQEFIREHGGSLQAARLPWEDCTDETKAADIREQVLSLSQDKRNFVRNPPNDFKFDPQTSYPIALSLLKEDPNLSKMRNELVPKLINEETFWCNYFYRFSLLIQMSEKGENFKKGWSSSRSSSGEGPDDVNEQTDEPLSPAYNSSSEFRQAPPAEPTSNTTDDVSATKTEFQAEELESSESRKLFAEADDLKSKLKELNIGSLDDGDVKLRDDNSDESVENEIWEEELQHDLEDFEFVHDNICQSDEDILDEELRELADKRSGVN